MPATKYTYSISGDFPNTAVASDKLLDEVAASSIVTAADRVDTKNDACDIWFVDALSGGDQTTLDGLVAVHDGVAPVDVSGSYAASDTESSTTSTAWLEKVSYAPAWLSAGDYEIEWSAEIKSTSSASCKIQVEYDDTTVVADIEDGTGGNWRSAGGFARVTLAAGTHNFDLDFTTSSDTKSVSVRRARLRLRSV